ncbi:peptidylprolyl isomerase [Barnesiella sp. An55]|uniref:peptidylprolyl isomerase n=1 Tax=Barnesiella sp. An55 TaxID=1965646 RepID=UPI000B383ED6|nr:peptidylprolyl isomerase [Barnesiella sp. An55]OUN72837.1 hypothetical protein B5G10_06620 [Barnesiella sp. An55]
MYKVSITALVAILSACLFTACRSGLQSDENSLVQVGDAILSRQEVNEAMPQGLSPADSADFAERYIQRWVNDELLYDVARKNVPDLERIDKLVEQYRRDLVIFEYRKRLLSERASKEFGEQEMRDYYEKNPDMFRLREAILKGLYLKVPESAPNIGQLKKWYCSTKPDGVEKIEKYALKNVVIYDYFYDRWVPFEEIVSNIPYEFGDPETFLKNHRNLEFNKNGYWYLLHITEFKVKGEVMPYDFAKTQIQEILANNNRLEFNRELEENLYNDAEKSGEIKWLYQREKSLQKDSVK